MRDYMSSWFTSALLNTQDRFRVSSNSADVESTLADQSYVINAKHVVDAGASIALNIIGENDFAVTSVYVDGSYPIEIRNQHATGSMDANYQPVNRNLASIADGVTAGDLVYNAIAAGELITPGNGSIDTYIVCNADSMPCVMVKNNSDSSQLIMISVGISEFGERPEPEVVTYSGENLTYNGEEITNA